MSAQAMASRSFADLPVDIVSIVADRAAVECRPRMRAVCSAWRAAVPVEPQPPWILLQRDDDTVSPERERRSGFSVVSFPTNANLSPGSSVIRCLNAFPAGSRCVGAGHGWLALVGADLSVTLVNPVTGRALSLPPLTRHHMAGSLLDDSGALGSRRNYPPVPAEEFRDMAVRKMAFSAAPEKDEYFAVMVGGLLSDAVYARAGSTAWQTLRDAHGDKVSLVRDVVHVEGGKFLAVTRGRGTVLQLDLAGSSPRVSTFAEGVLTFTDTFFMNTGAIEIRLVLVKGEVYLIWAMWELQDEEEDDDESEQPINNRYRITRAGVLRCDPDSILQTSCWSEVTDLGDWAVLVGRNETVAVRAGTAPRVRGSCLYFVDGRLEEAVLCAFDLRTGKQVASCDCEALRETRCMTQQWFNTPPAPLWFLPSLK